VKPLAIDLFCGLGGWTEGLLAEGWYVVGFDIERHDYGTGGYPGQLVLQDVLTLHGSQFKDAALIVASPPCQAYSYRAMPWSRAKALPPPDNSLFEACFRIQREASEAAGRHIPMVVENVRGAQKWVGRARWNFGSFYLWGDVPALMPMTKRVAKRPGHDWNRFSQTGEVSPHWRMDGQDSRKNNGGSWFNIGSPGQKEVGRNPVHELMGQKLPGNNAPRMWSERRVQRLRDAEEHPFYNSSSGSNARKAASAMIAKIPFVLSQYIAATFKPKEKLEAL
jgi:hypothetical protein